MERTEQKGKAEDDTGRGKTHREYCTDENEVQNAREEGESGSQEIAAAEEGEVFLSKDTLRRIWEQSRKEPACTLDDFFDRWWETMRPIVDSINALSLRIDRTNEGCRMIQTHIKEELGKCLRQSPEDE